MPNRNIQARQVTILGAGINIVLTAIKIAAGVLGHSTAIVADAFHSLSDLATDIATVWGVKAASKPVDKDHDYGHGKIEALVSGGIGLFLVLVGLKLFWQGTREILLFLQGDALPQPGWIAVGAAAISVVSKEWLYHRTIKVAGDIDSAVVKANAWHHRSDALSSLGVMIGISGAILLGENGRVLDPVAAVIVSVFILKAAFAITQHSSNELTDASLCDETENEILDIVKSVPGAQSPHDLRTRKIGPNVAIEVHVRVNDDLKITAAHDIATQVENKLRDRFGEQTFVSVHVEPEREEE